MIALDEGIFLIPVPAPPAPHILIVTPLLSAGIITVYVPGVVYVTGVDEVGATVEEAADGDEVGVLVDGKQVGKRYVEGANEGDVVGEAAVDVKVSTIAPFPPGD
jgi:hypothetical protein